MKTREHAQESKPRQPALLRCVCTHPWQDERYGTAYRVHTPLRLGGKVAKGATHRCTVCGAQR